MGKSLLKATAVFLAVFVAGLPHMEWGSFEYNVPAERPDPVHSDGTPIR